MIPDKRGSFTFPAPYGTEREQSERAVSHAHHSRRKSFHSPLSLTTMQEKS